MSAPALLMMLMSLGSVVAVVIGMRWLQADARLRLRVEGQRGGGQGTARPRGLQIPPPQMLARGSDLAEIERGLRLAGYWDPSSVSVFVWLRLGAALAVGLVSMLTCLLVNGNPFTPLFPTLALPGLTWISAKYVLKMRAAKREHTLMVEFPFLLDLMLMMLESGVSLDQCLRAIARDERVAVPNHSALVAMLVDDLDRGHDYESAFGRWAARVSVNGARELAALFRQSLFQGMELVPALREFIREFSERRVARARAAIGKITVRMVILMLVFFMPPLFIVLAGPPVTAIFDTLKGTVQ